MCLRLFLSVFLLVIITVDLRSQGLFEGSLTGSETSGEPTFDLGGYVRSIGYVSKDSDDQVISQSLYSELSIQSEIELGKYGRGFGEFRLRKGFEYGNKVSEIALREGWIDLLLGPVNIKTGKQVISQGTVSFINPTDQFIPRNPVVRSPVKDDIYLPVWAVNTNLLITSSSSLEVTWFPLYETSILLTEPFDFPDYLYFSESCMTGVKLENSAFNFSYKLRSTFCDLELMFFHGYRNNPALVMDTVMINMAEMRPDRISLKKEAYKINSAGLSFAIPISSYILRTEGCWMDPIIETGQQSDPLSEISYAAEIEQSGDQLTILAGYYGKYIINFREPISSPDAITGEFPVLSTLFPPGAVHDISVINDYLKDQTQSFHRLYEYQYEEFYHAVYAIGTMKLFHDLLELEIPGMYNFTAGELTMMPSLKLNITDGLSIKAGMYMLRGKEGSLFDMVGSTLNAGWISLKAGF